MHQGWKNQNTSLSLKDTRIEKLNKSQPGRYPQEDKSLNQSLIVLAI